MRVRPFLEEYDAPEQRELAVHEFNKDSKANVITVLAKEEGQEVEKQFHVDHAFWSHDQYEVKEDGFMAPKTAGIYACQSTLYQKFGKLVVDGALEGYNTCLVACG